MRLRDMFSPAPNMNVEKLQEFIDSKKEGSFILLDVRQLSEHESSRIPGSKLIPLPILKDRLQELDPQKPVITY